MIASVLNMVMMMMMMIMMMIAIMRTIVIFVLRCQFFLLFMQHCSDCTLTDVILR